MMKRLLKLSLTTITGLIVLMLVVGVGVHLAGIWVSGGGEKWEAALESAAPYLLVWRIIIYSVAAGFWISAYRMYQAKEATEATAEGKKRMKKIGALFILLILFIEVPKFF